MRDRLPHRSKPIECGIVNLDSYKRNGTHWVAYAKIYNYCEYFNSFGDLKPPTELVKYLIGSKIYYNYTRFQHFNTVNCGHLCIDFLQNFWYERGIN